MLNVDQPFELNLLIACRISMAFSFFFTALCDLFQVYVLVTVEPEGVVAKPNVTERELALFNIGAVELFLYNSFQSSFMISEIKLVKQVTNFIKSMYELCESLGIPVQNHRMNQPFEPRQALCISKFGSSILDACYTQFI